MNLCLSNGFAQDYTQWRLPDGAKARIGKGRIKDIKFSPDGCPLASGNWRGDIQLWDVETHQHITDFIDAKGTTEALKFFPDGRTLVKDGSLGFVKLWDVETKTRIWWNHSAHADSVTRFAFTPDGRTFVSGSDDGTILH